MDVEVVLVVVAITVIIASCENAVIGCESVTDSKTLYVPAVGNVILLLVISASSAFVVYAKIVYGSTPPVVMFVNITF